MLSLTTIDHTGNYGGYDLTCNVKRALLILDQMDQAKAIAVLNSKGYLVASIRKTPKLFVFETRDKQSGIWVVTRQVSRKFLA